jgi:ribosomal protein S3AE
MKNHKLFFSNIDYDAHHHLAKTQIRIQLVQGESKMTNFMVG